MHSPGEHLSVFCSEQPVVEAAGLGDRDGATPALLSHMLLEGEGKGEEKNPG